MQAGVTGINAMRVYNVTKQAKDQDPGGVFIRKYIPELRYVPTKYIHEPHKVPKHLVEKCGKEFKLYPKQIVDEKQSAKQAKDILAAIKTMSTTKRMARRVYQKHGSRKNAAKNKDYSNLKRKKDHLIVGDEMGGGAKLFENDKKKCKRSQQTIVEIFSRNDAYSKQKSSSSSTSWSCNYCTFVNEKLDAPVCEVCLKCKN